MLYALEGKVIDKRGFKIFLEVNGVTFEILVTPTFFEEVKVNERALVYVFMVKTEEEDVLYGFKTPLEREIFRNLIKLQGIGTGLVYRIMSAMKVEELVKCLEEGNVKRLSEIKGVGPKRAERIVFETQGLAKSLKIKAEDVPLRSKAIAGLVALGLKEQEAKELIDKVLKRHSDVQRVEDLIKLALGGGDENN